MNDAMKKLVNIVKTDEVHYFTLFSNLPATAFAHGRHLSKNGAVLRYLDDISDNVVVIGSPADIRKSIKWLREEYGFYNVMSYYDYIMRECRTYWLIYDAETHFYSIYKQEV